jgi:hypothetical protein
MPINLCKDQECLQDALKKHLIGINRLTAAQAIKV